jgi:hypothetical protein
MNGALIFIFVTNFMAARAKAMQNRSDVWPNHTLQPTPVGAVNSAFAGYVTGSAWLSLGR